jgi:hypothetical protein
VDGKEGVQMGAFFPPGTYAFEILNVILKQSKGGLDERTGVDKPSIPYIEVALSCIAGEFPDMVGESITDRLMCKGKGVTRFKVFAKALGMWDDEGDRFAGRPLDFIGGRVWATVKTEKSKDKAGNERERSIIDFAGYMPIDKYPLPDDELYGDVADEEEVAVAPAVAAPVVVDEDDDLEAGELEDDGQDEAEVAPPAAARPRARAAGAAGGQPPWKQ